MKKRTIYLLGGGALGAVSYLGVRLYIRSEVERTLRDTYQYDAQVERYRPLVAGLNLPTATELAAALVPLLSTTGPYKAIEDVLVNGRDSVFWPVKRRTTKAPKWVDDAIFTVLRRMYEQSEGKKLTG